MGVTSVGLYKLGTDGNRSNDGKAKYNAQYIVETDTYLDQTAVICNHFRDAGNLPYLNSPYEYANDRDDNAICTSIAPRRQANSQTSWIVTLEYGTPQSQQKDDDQPRQEPDNNGDLTPDPARWRERWDIGFTQISIPVEGAIYVSGIATMPVGRFMMPANSAGDPFIPPLEKEQDIAVLRRSYYVDLWDHSFVDFYQGTINNNAVAVIGNGFAMRWTADPYTLRCKSIGGSLEWINNAGWWRIDIEWWKKTDTWDVFVCDRGLNRRAEIGAPTGRGTTFEQTDLVTDPATGFSTRAMTIPILDADGNPVRTPVFLDGSGRPLISFTQPINYIRYRIYNAVDYPNNMFMR